MQLKERIALREHRREVYITSQPKWKTKYKGVFLYVIISPLSSHSHIFISGYLCLYLWLLLLNSKSEKKDTMTPPKMFLAPYFPWVSCPPTPFERTSQMARFCSPKNWYQPENQLDNWLENRSPTRSTIVRYQYFHHSLHHEELATHPSLVCHDLVFHPCKRNVFGSLRLTASCQAC